MQNNVFSQTACNSFFLFQVCLSSPTKSRFETWLLQKDNIQVHRCFLQTPSPNTSTPEEVKRWKFLTQSDTMPRVRQRSNRPVEFWCDPQWSWPLNIQRLTRNSTTSRVRFRYFMAG